MIAFNPRAFDTLHAPKTLAGVQMYLQCAKIGKSRRLFDLHYVAFDLHSTETQCVNAYNVCGCVNCVNADADADADARWKHSQ